jgi:transposase-like protein
VIIEGQLAAARLTPTDKRPMHAIAKTLGVSHATMYRHLNLSAAELDGRQPA